MIPPAPGETMPHRIFIVEDHPVMREAYAQVLQMEPDIELCGTAASAEEAIEALDAPAERLACDLVVTDLGLPGRSGFDLVRHLHTTRPGLPVLVISGHEEPSFARDARSAGAVAYLPKRNLVDTFVETIHSLLDAPPA